MAAEAWEEIGPTTLEKAGILLEKEEQDQNKPTDIDDADFVHVFQQNYYEVFENI